MNICKKPGCNGDVYVPYEERSGNESIVYFTRELSAEGLIKAYEKVNGNITGKVGVKLHTGEQNGPNIIPRQWVKELMEKDLPDANIIETNTYYEGDRYTTEQHRQTLEVNGWTFRYVDIMDEGGTALLPVKGGKWFKNMSVGVNMTNYDSMVALTHFKGHVAGGFGGSNKNIGIGCADGRIGKAWIHTTPGQPDQWDIVEEELMERISESTKALCSSSFIAKTMSMQAWSMARMSVDDRMPTLGVTTGSAAKPSQSHDTDMLRITLT